MGNFEFKRNPGGFLQLLRSPEAKTAVTEYGNATLNRLPAGLYKLKTGTGRTRAYAVVHPANAEGYYKERKHGYALKALKG